MPNHVKLFAFMNHLDMHSFLCLLPAGAHGVVVSHPLSMREALGSIPSVSTSFFAASGELEKPDGRTNRYSLRGSNPRPMAHKTIALTTELRERSATRDASSQAATQATAGQHVSEQCLAAASRCK